MLAELDLKAAFGAAVVVVCVLLAGLAGLYFMERGDDE